MKQYRITKLIYADSLSEATAKEGEAHIVETTLFDEFNEEDWKTHVARKRQIKLKVTELQNGG